MNLRDELRTRGLPRSSFPLCKVQPADAQAARAALDEAIRVRDRTPGIAPHLERAVTDAKSVLAACYEDVTVRALPRGDMEALIAAHPPADQQSGLAWDPESFPPALLAAAVEFADGEVWSEADWRDMTSGGGPLALGEVSELFDAAYSLNKRVVDLRVGRLFDIDATFEAEMALCERYQISYSHFTGGPAVWTQADRDKALAYRIRKAETCPNCGTRPDEWNPDKGGHRHAYLPTIEIDPGCEQRQRKEAELQTDAWKNQKGAYVALRPNPAVRRGG